MAITKIEFPNSTPSSITDWERSVSMHEYLSYSLNNPISWDFSSNTVKKGVMIQIGGSVYLVDADTAITGTASNYVRITPSGTTATAAYVSSLTGVTWNDAFNFYNDGSGNAYLFDEMQAVADNVITSPKLLGGWISDNPRFNEDVEARSSRVYFTEKTGSSEDLIWYSDVTNIFNLIGDGSGPEIEGKDSGSGLSVGTVGIETSGNILTANADASETINHVKNTGSGLALFRATESNYLGTFFGYDAGGNFGVIGVHNTGDENPVNDIVAIELNRATGACTFKDDLDVDGTFTAASTGSHEIGTDSTTPGATILTLSSQNGRAITIKQPNPLDVAAPFTFDTGNSFDFVVDGTSRLLIDDQGDVNINNDLTVGGDLTLSMTSVTETFSKTALSGTGTIISYFTFPASTLVYGIYLTATGNRDNTGASGTYDLELQHYVNSSWQIIDSITGIGTGGTGSFFYHPLISSSYSLLRIKFTAVNQLNAPSTLQYYHL